MGERIFECNIKPEHLDVVYNGPGGFWSQVMVAWMEYSFAMPSDVNDILEQVLWFNSLIRVNDVPFIFKRAYEAGIVKVRDIVSTDKRFYTFQELIQRYGHCMTWLEYQQILCSIHPQWKREIAHGLGDSTPMGTFARLQEHSKWSSIVYNALIDRDCDILLETKRARWSRYLSQEIDPVFFGRCFRDITKTTIATQLRDFQYRLLHCIIFLNDRLYLWKLVDSELCTLCKTAKESYIHFFWECRYARMAWTSFKDYIEQNDQSGVQYELTLNPYTVIFNVVHAKPSHVINLLVLVTKQYLFQCKCTKVKPNTESIINEYNKVYNIETFIAKQNNTLRKHNAKWAPIMEELEEDLTPSASG